MREMRLQLLELPLPVRFVMGDAVFDLLSGRVIQECAPCTDQAHGLLE